MVTAEQKPVQFTLDRWISMTDDRFDKWVRNSFAAARFEQFLPVTIQMLGRLDCHLIAEDGRFGQLPGEQRGAIPEALRLTDRFCLSYLWVLGAYEVIRTIHQRALEGARRLNDGLVDEIAELKRRFARLRIPLAKMEPAKAHQQTDSPIAFPALHPELGTAWQVAPGVFVSRRELSDALLDLLGRLRATDPSVAH